MSIAEVAFKLHWSKDSLGTPFQLGHFHARLLPAAFDDLFMQFPQDLLVRVHRGCRKRRLANAPKRLDRVVSGMGSNEKVKGNGYYGTVQALYVEQPGR
jgi:hypothetical protein